MSEEDRDEQTAAEDAHVIRCPRIFGLEVKVTANTCDHANRYSECGRCPFAKL